jgi:tRNA A37 threonylcarbamoyltransferase TsaD
LQDENLHRGHIVELLAQYGDPSEFELPIGFKNETNADMTFAGVKTKI